MTYEEQFEAAYDGSPDIRRMVDEAQAKELSEPPQLTESELSPELTRMWEDIGQAVDEYTKGAGR